MNRQSLDPKQVQILLESVSKKVGIPAQQLQSELESGKYDKVLHGLSSKDAATLQKVLQNPKMLDKLIRSPQAKALYEKLQK